jgi:UrcA family protein
MRYPAIMAAAALGAAAVLAVPAAAETSVGVKYSDLNLSTKEGQDRLERRIDSAARSACALVCA